MYWPQKRDILEVMDDKIGMTAPEVRTFIANLRGIEEKTVVLANIYGHLNELVMQYSIKRQERRAEQGRPAYEYVLINGVS